MTMYNVIDKCVT